MTEKTTVILVRHGQTPWNPVGKLRGRAPVPLDETGEAQAAATGAYIAPRWTPDAIYASPLKRTLQTATAIVQACETSLPIVDYEGLLDIDSGTWTGVDTGVLADQYPKAWAGLWEAPQHASFPEGESLVDASDRAYKTFREIVAQHPGQTVFMISHTAINRLILMRILDIPLAHFWHIGQDTCAINVIECDGQTCIVRKMNMTHHLES